MFPMPDSEQPMLAKLKPLGPAPENRELEITLYVRPDPRKDWSAVAEQAVDQRQFLDKKSFRQAWKASRRDIRAVVDFAEANDLEVLEASTEKRRVRVLGTVPRLNAAFDVELKTFEVGGDTIIGYHGRIYLSGEEMLEIVVGILGLCECTLARPNVAWYNPAYTPRQLRRIYDFPADLSGQGQHVAITELDGGFHWSDLEAYFSAIDLPMPEITVVDPELNRPAPQEEILNYLCSGGRRFATDGVIATYEATMDVELVGSLANRADILVFFGKGTTDQDIFLLMSEVLMSEKSIDIVSNSWNLQTSCLPGMFIDMMEDLFLGFAAMGTTVCYSSGDEGSNPPGVCGDMPLEVYYPGSSSWVISCGATLLEAEGDVITSETVWNALDRAAGERLATGGGVSRLFPTPDWQKDAGVAEKTGWNGRGVPDVAAVGDPAAGVTFFLAGIMTGSGGTSASVQIWAAFVALLNEALASRLGQLQPLIYREEVAETFRAITEGNNHLPENEGLYYASSGWNPCGGLGSPNGTRLIEALRKELRDSTDQ